MRAASEADLVVSLALRAADAAYRGGPATAELVVTAGAKLTGEDAAAWAAARVAELRTTPAPSDDERTRGDAAAAVALATALVESDPADGSGGADLMPAPTGVIVVGPDALRSTTDVVGAVLAGLAAGGAVVVVSPPDAPVSTRATVEALATASVAAGGPAGVVQCVGPEVGALVATDPRVALVVPGRPAGAVPVVAGPGTDPVALARLLVADSGRCGRPGPFAPTVLIAAPEVVAALAAAPPGPLEVMAEADVGALRRGSAAPPESGVRVRLAPIPALVPEDSLARCSAPEGTAPVATVPVVTVDDAARAVRAVHAAVRVGGGPGPVLVVHGPAWRPAVLAAAAAAGFGRISVDGPTTPTDPLAAAPLRPTEALRWTRVTGWAGPWPGPGGTPTPPSVHPPPVESQPPYPYPSNRESA